MDMAARLALDNGLRVVVEGILHPAVSEERVASWYRLDDPVAGLQETVFNAAVTPAAALDQVLKDVSWTNSARK